MTTPERANNFRYIVLEALGILADNLGPIAAQPPADEPPSPVRLPTGRLPNGALSTVGGQSPPYDRRPDSRINHANITGNNISYSYCTSALMPWIRCSECHKLRFTCYAASLPTQ